jgi:hypothetical protein
VFPWGADYEEPEAIRICYPNVALRGQAVHFCGVSDIIEPNRKWRAYKKQLTGQAWDYDFRRLFYTWCDDLTQGQFHAWVEIASREQTCGWITPGDLWLAPDGDVHLLWTERALDERLRAAFFPDEKQSYTLHYAVLRAGQIVRRHTLLRAEEGGPQEVPGRSRFHVASDGRLFAVCFVSGRSAVGQPVAEDRLFELGPAGPRGDVVRIPLQQPLTDFFTATVRAGSVPSNTLDLLGPRAGTTATISYARIRLP